MDTNKGIVIAFAASLFSGAALQATAATVAEYDKATTDQQSEFVSVVLKNVHQHYRSADSTKPKARCMERLYETKNSSGTPRLFTLVANEIDKARDIDADKYKVENLIYGVVEHECSIPTEIVDAAPPTPGNT